MSTVYRITGAQAVTRILAGIAIGAFILVLLSLLWKPQRVRARPYVDDSGFWEAGFERW